MTESPATVSVTQADRDAAATWIWEHVVSDPLQTNVLKGEWITELVQAFAHHRLSAIASVTDAPDPTATLDARLNERKSLFKQMRDHDAPAIPAQPDSIPLPEPTAEQQGYLNKRWAAHLRSQQFDPNTVIGGPSPAQPDGGLVEKLEALVHAVGVTHRKFDGYELGDTLSFVTQTREVDTAKVALANHVLDQWGPLLEALRRPAPDDLPDPGVAMVSEPGRDAVVENAVAQIKAYVDYLETIGIAPDRPTEVQESLNLIARSLKALSIPEDAEETVAKALAEELNARTGIVIMWESFIKPARAAIASMPRLDQVRREALEEAAKVTQYCDNCDCDLCAAQQQAASIKAALAADEKAVCWSCSCGWIACYTQADLAEYSEPSECNKCHRERLSECDPARLRALSNEGRAE